MAAGIKFTTGISSQNDGKIIMGVTIGIRMSTSPYDHGVVQQTLSIDVFRRLHSLKEVCQLLGIESVDLNDLIHLSPIITMMGKSVVPFAHPQMSKVAVTPVVRQEEGRNPGLVRLESYEHHIEEQSDVLLILTRHTFLRSLDTRIWWRTKALGFFNTTLNLTNPGHVFIELVAIVSTKLLVHRLGVAHDDVENGTFLCPPLGQALHTLFI